MKQQTLKEFLTELEAQGVPTLHYAFTCPICGTIQSGNTLLLAGVPRERVENIIGFSCVGRYNNAGSFDSKKDAPGKGCNWTLGGLFQIHKLEVIDEQGNKHPRFEIASPTEAQELMQSTASAVTA